MRGRIVQALVAAALVAAAGAAAQAAPIIDTFFVTGQGNNEIYDGGGSGWDGGRWIKYDETNWWNEWFYDHPPDPTRWKEIAYDILVMPSEPVPGGIVLSTGTVEIALNWSTLGYPPTGPGGPPPMPWEEPVIMREVIYAGPSTAAASVVGEFIIPGFNPEWISIDVRFTRLWQYDPDTQLVVPYQVTASGTVEHECVPEPATIGFLIVGGLGLMAARRRAR